MRFLPCGSSGLLVELADLAQTLALDAALRADPPDGVLARIPAARSILLSFEPRQTSAAALAAAVQQRALTAATAAPERPSQLHEIAVVYDGEDLQDVARLTGLSPAEVMARHMDQPWTVAFNGFAPGFSYLSGGDPALQVPRRSSPRVIIPAGSVALAGAFSGIYPKASPGGWQLIGRSTAALWGPQRQPPALLHPGDRVQFTAARKLYAAAVPPAAPDRAPFGDHLTLLAAPLPALLQDHGRPGFSQQGVAASGALDHAALRQLNRLLGNPHGTAALEITGGGLAFQTSAAVEIALTGAPCPLRLNGLQELPAHQVLALNAGDRVQIMAPVCGWRSYLGLRGGFAVTPVLGSAATDLLSGLGPAPLRAGDRVGLARAAARAVMAPEPMPHLPRPGEITRLDVVLGPRDDWLTAEQLARFTGQNWHVSPQSSRIGLRLSGAPILRKDARDLPSEGCVAGAIQLPHSGLPVVFLADHPITGGYPVIAVVAAHHLDLLAQLPPDALLRFQPLPQAAPDTADPRPDPCPDAKPPHGVPR